MTESNALAELDRLEQRLATIRTPRDAKAEARWAAVMMELARALGLSRAEQNRIAEHRLRAQRRGGNLLREIDPKPGRPRTGNTSTLEAFSIDEHESHRWQAIAGLDEPVFEGYIIDENSKPDGEITTAGVLKLVPKPSKPVPEPGELEPMRFLRFCQDLSNATIVSLILRVLFPDAETALDLTYGSGNFWDGTQHVRVTAHDSDASRAPDGVVDFTDVDYPNEHFDVVIYDPPHLADTGNNSIMGTRFGTYASGEIKAILMRGTCEAWRVARLGIVAKVTDHVHAQEYQIETDWIREALDDRKPYDVVYQVRSGALEAPMWEDQLSPYNNGGTFLIFRKGDQRHIRR